MNNRERFKEELARVGLTIIDLFWVGVVLTFIFLIFAILN